MDALAQSFHQPLTPLGGVLGSTLIALIPVAVLLVLLAVARMSAWRAVLVGSAVTVLLAIFCWHAPVGDVFAAYGLGAASGVWSIDWIVFWA
jgi:lactate permease